MRIAFMRGEIVGALLEISAEDAPRYAAAYGFDGYMPADIDDPALRPLGEGCKVPGAANKRAGGIEVDRAKVSALVPAASVPAGELAAAKAAGELAEAARLVELAEAKGGGAERGGK